MLRGTVDPGDRVMYFVSRNSLTYEPVTCTVVREMGELVQIRDASGKLLRVSRESLMREGE